MTAPLVYHDHKRTYVRTPEKVLYESPPDDVLFVRHAGHSVRPVIKATKTWPDVPLTQDGNENSPSSRPSKVYAQGLKARMWH